MWDFVVIFIVGLGMIGSAMYMLQLSLPGHERIDDRYAVVEEFTGHFLFDMIRNQYLLSLGDFYTEGYEEHPLWFLCLSFFIGATFFSQIVMLNMLIAIMGNTFSMVIERKAEYSMQTKMSMIGDFKQVLATQNKFKIDSGKQLEKFLFVVRPILDEEEKEDQNRSEWSGGFQSIK